MAYELREGQGSLFRVEEKKNERGPDYEGKLHVGGKTYRLAGWLKQGAKGKFLSIKAEEAREQPALTGGMIGRAAKDIDSDIPQ